jgi:hypothetical protein
LTAAQPNLSHDPHRHHAHAFEAIAATLPLDSVRYEPQLNTKGEARLKTRPRSRRVAIDRAGIPPGDAMSDRADPAELLDIEMDKLARVLALIATDRLGRLQRSEPVETEPTQDAADGRVRYSKFASDLLRFRSPQPDI